MKLVTADLMRRIDQETIEHAGIPGPQLMENAGRGIAERILTDILEAPGGVKFAVFCGKGNNGGDGFVVARYLFQSGAEVSIYYLGPKDQLSKDARLNLDRAAKLKLHIESISSIAKLPDELDVDYIIDAIFGTGFEGAPRDLSAELIQYINQQMLPVISVDLPSGLNADTGQHEGVVIDADHTFTLALPKYGLYVSPGRELAGSVVVVPIGIPDDTIDKFAITCDLIIPERVSENLPERPADAHKGIFGKLFVLAGSLGLTGAAVLAARSALRGGVGLVKVGCPHSVQPVIANGIVEATTLALPDVAKKGVLALRGLGQIRKEIQEHEAVVIGPGIGRHRETFELVRRLLLSLEKPAIVDADGLNALDGHLEVLENTTADLIITPHPGEFQRLTGKVPPDDIHERIAMARQFALEYQTILVLKGSPTIVANIDGTCFVNQTGNSGMATGGTGDVLSGLIGSFLAQGMSTIDAAVCGVYVHGYAGDFAAKYQTGRTMIAGDLINYFPDVFDLLE